MRGLTEAEAEILRKNINGVAGDEGDSPEAEIELCERLADRGLMRTERAIYHDDEYEVWITTALGQLALRLHDAERLILRRTA